MTASQKKSGRIKWRLFKWTLIAALLLCLLTVGLAIITYVQVLRDPKVVRLTAIHDYRPKQLSQVLSREGKRIAELGEERRTVVAYNKIPKRVIQAFVSAEDAAFFKHKGLDYWGVLRAFIKNVLPGGLKQGGSTITQQVVKTFFLSPERTIRRKLAEALLSHRLEKQLTKEEILFLYLNQIYFGHGRYGVQEASRFFFHKDVSDLTILEASLLAGLPQSPSRYSPFRHPERVKRRRSYVLTQLAKTPLIDESKLSELKEAPLGVVSTPMARHTVGAEFADVVKRKLGETFGSKKTNALAATVTTTAHAGLQAAAKQAVATGLRRLDQQMGYTKAKPIRSSAKKVIADLGKAQPKLVNNRSYSALVRSVSEDDAEEQRVEVDLGHGSTSLDISQSRYNRDKVPLNRRFKVDTIVKVEWREGAAVYDPGPQAALIAVDPKTGDVLAMVGGYNFSYGGFNRATRAKRQPGSAFKPFIYGAAIDSHLFSPGTIVNDAPVTYKGWEPKNFSGRYSGQIRLRTALARSINTVAAQLIYDVGITEVQDFARKAGIRVDLGNDLSIALGSASLTPEELVQAYIPYANGGKGVDRLRYIKSVDGKETPPLELSERISEDTAFIMRTMLHSVVTSGTATRAAKLDKYLSGKTGTTNDGKDAWFMGFSSDLLMVVWVGFDTPTPMGRGATGSKCALPIWIDVMKAAIGDRGIHVPGKGIPKMPEGVTTVYINKDTGKRQDALQSGSISEYFVRGTEPMPPAEGHVDTKDVLTTDAF